MSGTILPALLILFLWTASGLEWRTFGGPQWAACTGILTLSALFFFKAFLP